MANKLNDPQLKYKSKYGEKDSVIDPIILQSVKYPRGHVYKNGGKPKRSLVDQKDRKIRQLKEIQTSVSVVKQFMEKISNSTTIEVFNKTREENHPDQVFDDMIQNNYNWFIYLKTNNKISVDLMNHIMNRYFPLRNFGNHIGNRISGVGNRISGVLSNIGNSTKRSIPAKVSETKGSVDASIPAKVSVSETIGDASIPYEVRVPNVLSLDDDELSDLELSSLDDDRSLESLESVESVDVGGAKRKNARRKKKRSTRKSKKRNTRRPTKRSKKSRKNR
jgi:hypothetical protein